MSTTRTTLAGIRPHPGEPTFSGDGLPREAMCVRCMKTAGPADLVTSACPHDPRIMRGAGLGVYRCAHCQGLVIEGLPHGPLCRVCAGERRQFYADEPASATDAPTGSTDAPASSTEPDASRVPGKPSK